MCPVGSIINKALSTFRNVRLSSLQPRGSEVYARGCAACGGGGRGARHEHEQGQAARQGAPQRGPVRSERGPHAQGALHAHCAH